MQKVIHIGSVLSSSFFYSSILSGVIFALRYHDRIENIILDFSETKNIEPIVIPNLLCLGRETKILLGSPIILRIPDTAEGGMLKNYLNEIDFIRLSKDVFDYETDPYTGITGKTIDPLCGTIYTDEQATEDEIYRKVHYHIEPFSEKYLKRYDVFNENTEQNENLIIHFLEELIMNARFHSGSYSYATMHARYSNHMIYIAVSDTGIGMLRSCIEEHRKELENRNIILHNEYDALRYCLSYRKESDIFGLNAITKKVLKSKGIIRYHSNDTRLNFMSNEYNAVDRVSQDLAGLPPFFTQNGLRFGGAHIEIEIPF